MARTASLLVGNRELSRLSETPSIGATAPHGRDNSLERFEEVNSEESYE